MNKDWVIVFRNDQHRIASFVGGKAEPVARSWEKAKRFGQREAQAVADRYNEEAKRHGLSGYYTAEGL